MKRELLAALCLAAIPLAVNAQGCIGTPSRDGDYAVAANLGIASGAKSYGVEVSRNMLGPLTIGAAYAMTDFDNTSTNGNSFGGGVAWELTMPGASMCPTARIMYSRVHESTFGGEATVNQIVVPLGFGIGKSFPASPGLSLLLFGEPKFLYIRSSVDASAGGLGSFSASGSNNEVGADLGLRLTSATFYAGASMSFTTIDNSDPVFGLIVGAVVGGKR